MKDLFQTYTPLNFKARKLIRPKCLQTSKLLKASSRALQKIIIETLQMWLGLSNWLIGTLLSLFLNLRQNSEFAWQTRFEKIILSHTLLLIMEDTWRPRMDLPS